MDINKKMRLATMGLVVLFCGGCSDTVNFVRQPSLIDRCADFMTRSYPGGGDIEITNKQAAPQSNEIVIVTVTARRKNIPADSFLASDVAAQCRFDNSILTEFRWTAGPLR